MDWQPLVDENNIFIRCDGCGEVLSNQNCKRTENTCDACHERKLQDEIIETRLAEMKQRQAIAQEARWKKYQQEYQKQQRQKMLEQQQEEFIEGAEAFIRFDIFMDIITGRFFNS